MKNTEESTANIDELIDLNFDEMEELQLNRKDFFGLATGYSRLDSLTCGLQNSDLILVASRPAMGKTSFALNIARNVAFKGNVQVGIFSIGMSKLQLSMRLMTSEAKTDSQRLMSGLVTRENWDKITDAAGLLNDLPIFIDDSSNITVTDIREKALRIKEERGLGLIIIDYLQLIDSPVKLDRKDLEIAEISKKLKFLAKELDIPVLALSQLSRTLEQRNNKRPILSDLRESGALEEDADVVTFIYRDEIYNTEWDNPNKGKAEIIVAKNRKGPTGTVNMHFLSQYTRFEELSSETYQDFE